MKRIFFFILLLVCFKVDAQVKQKPTTYGIQYRRLQADSGLRIPTVQIGTKDNYAGFDTAQLYYRKSDSALLTYTGSQWILARGAAGGGMVYPGAGIPLSTGSAWGTSITDNSANWNTAFGWGNHATAGYFSAALLPDSLNNYWRKTGNVGNSFSSNFIGTKDAVGISFRVSDTAAGRIGVEKVSSRGFVGSVALGMGAMQRTPEGAMSITAIGSSALRDYLGLSDGQHTAVGVGALRNLTAGYRNTAVGEWVFFQGVSGHQHNTGLGVFAGEVVGVGSFNTFIGSSAGRNIKDGNYNTATGMFSSLSLNTQIDSVTITNGGSGYTTATATFSAPGVASPGTTSVQATGTCVISGGAVVSITMTEKGLGYTTDLGDLAVTISGDGTGATGTPVLKSATGNTTSGYAAMLYNRVGNYNAAYGYLAGHDGFDSPVTTSSYLDDYMSFFGSNSSRHSSIPYLTKLTNGTAIGYNAKIGVSNGISMGDSALQVKVGIGTAFPTAKLTIQAEGNSTSTTSLNIKSLAGSPLFNVNDGGRVGIGTTTPVRKFEVVGDDIRVRGVTIGHSPSSSVNSIAIGDSAMYEAVTAGGIAIGVNSQRKIQSGSNISIGTFSMDSATTSNSIIAIGSNTLRLGGGTHGIAIGTNSSSKAVHNGSSWTGSTAVGNSSLNSMTTGLNNQVFGIGAGFSIISGSYNTALGSWALGAGTSLGGTASLTGNANIAIGVSSLLYLPGASSNNISIGNNSGIGLTAVSSNNIIIGQHNGSIINGFSDHIIIADGNGDLRIMIDSIGNTGIGVQVPLARLHSVSTTEQLRLGYNASNYLSATINSTGSLTIGLTGTTPTTTFSQDVLVPDEAYDATAWDGSLEVPTKNAIRDKIETLGGGTYYNSNVGSAYRWVIPNTNNIKTASAGVGILIDSATANQNDIAIAGYQNWANNTTTTSDATVTTLATIATPNDSRGTLEVTLIGIETGDVTTGLTGKKFVHWKNVAGTVTVLQVVDEEADYRETFTTATWTVDASSGNLRVRVTGEAATSCTWNSVHKLKYQTYSL